MLAALPLLGGCEQLSGMGRSEPQTQASSETTVGSYRTVTVGRGDSIHTIAKRENVPVRDLIELNGLRPPYRLEAGQELRLPTTRTYTVRSGDALSKLAQRYQIDTAELARLNRIPPPYAIRVGQVLVLPGGGDSGTSLAMAPVPGHKPEGPESNPVHGSIQAVPLPPPSTVAQPEAARRAPTPLAPPVTAYTPPAASGSATPTRPQPRRTTSSAAVSPPPSGVEESTPVATAAASSPPIPTPTAAAPPARAGGRMIWPLRGKVISDFGDKPDGRHNDGLNIAATKGAPVVAVDNGVVDYVGNELRSYGNLLLVRHANGLMTAYAHLDRTLVERGSAVRRGQKIGTVGATGTVTSPQLHFEVRKGSQAVDPGDFLEPAAEGR